MGVRAYGTYVPPSDTETMILHMSFYILLFYT